MNAMASQITSITIVCTTVYSDPDKKKYQSFASLAFVRGIPRGPVNSPHKWPVTRKMSPFDDAIIIYRDVTDSDTSEEALWAAWHQAIPWTSADTMSIGFWCLGTNIVDIWIEVNTSSRKKVDLKMSPAKCHNFVRHQFVGGKFRSRV